MIIRARAVVTMDGAPISNGAVAITGNKISAVGTWEDVRQENLGEVIDLGERVLLPGMINAHCHLDYTCLRGRIARQESFTSWIRAINEEKAKLSPDDFVRSINDGFAEARRFGTTTIANLTAFPELIARVEPSIRTRWFAEMIDLRGSLDLEAVRGMLPSSGGLAPHAPYTASADLYQRCEKIAERDDLLLTTHLAESNEEMLMAAEQRGPLAEFLTSISQQLFEADGATPVEHLAKFCRLNERWLLVHVNEIVESDFEKIAKTHIVHCPRSHAYFGHTRFKFAELKARGLNVSLGTDSLASNDDLSLFAEMRQMRETEPSISARELLEMVTLHPARALRRADALGRLRAGFAADLIAVPFPGPADSLLDEIVAFKGSVPWMMIDGQSVAAP